MKHTPHPALIGSYNNGRDLNDIMTAYKAERKKIQEEMEEERRARLWNLAHIKAIFGRKK